MNRFLRASVAVAFLGALTACYHATIETELTPSEETIDVPWASGWAWGLVPPPLVETAERCTNGVARVETVHSFVNMLVGGLTLGIYTPMTIKVTCAAGGTASADRATQIEVSANTTQHERRKALTEAAHLSMDMGAPVYVVITE